MLSKTLQFSLIAIFVQCAFAGAPQIVVPASGDGWRDPVFAPDGNSIAFANADLSELYVLIHDEKTPRTVARSNGIGRRFVYTPDGQRLAFRMKIEKLPAQPERLISSSIYLFDPIHHSQNMESNLFGPYFFDNRVWYRRSLAEPYVDFNNRARVAGPYWDPNGNSLIVLNDNRDSVFTSLPGQRFAGAEISPDGRWIAAVESRPAVQLHLIRIENGQTQTISQAFAPGWSGDSQRLVCCSKNPQGIVQMLFVNVASGESVVLLNDPRLQPETPALNADGTTVLFVGNGAIYKMEIP